MDWITDQIAIGSVVDATSLPDNVDAVLCLLPDCCGDRFDVHAFSVPMVDGRGNDAEAVRMAIDYLAEVLGDGRKILVHCHAGRSRSVVVVARYLMLSKGISSELALKIISERRSIYLSDGIEEWLHRRI